MGNANIDRDTTLGTPVTVANGGTGVSTLTGVLTGNGTSAFTANAITEGGVLLGGASNAVTDTGVLAKGSLLVGDGAGAPTELAVGTNDYVLTADSAEGSGVKWAAASSGATDYSTTSIVVDDFNYLSSTQANNGIFPWTSVGWSPLDFNETADLVAGIPGVIELTRTRTTVNVFGTWFAGLSTAGHYLLGGGQQAYYWRLQIPTVSAGANSFKTIIGVCEYTNLDVYGTYPNDGIFLTQVDDENSGNWILECRATSSSTQTNSSSTPDTGWHTYGIVVNSGATSVEFFLDGVSLGTVASTIPTGKQLSPFVRVDVEDNSTTAIIKLDAYWHEITRA